MKRMVIAVAVLFIAITVCADLIIDFCGNGGAFDFEKSAETFKTNGITMSFFAFDSDVTNAKLNATSSSFGVNSTDDVYSDQIEIGQSITIQFHSSEYNSIKLQAINLSSFGPNDIGYYRTNTGPKIAINDKDDVLDLLIDVFDKNLEFGTTAGNGIGLNGIVLEIVPEPTMIAMLGIGGVIIFIRCYLSRSNRWPQPKG